MTLTGPNWVRKLNGIMLGVVLSDVEKSDSPGLWTGAILLCKKYVEENSDL